MGSNTKTILMRFARGLGAVVVASLAAWVVGPDATALIPADWQFVVVGMVAPALLALEKWLRDGGDASS